MAKLTDEEMQRLCVVVQNGALLPGGEVVTCYRGEDNALPTHNRTRLVWGNLRLTKTVAWWPRNYQAEYGKDADWTEVHIEVAVPDRILFWKTVRWVEVSGDGVWWSVIRDALPAMEKAIADVVKGQPVEAPKTDGKLTLVAENGEE